MRFKAFQYSHLVGHLRYRKNNLVILNLYAALSVSDASHQVLAQSALRCWRRCHFKNFKVAALVTNLVIGMEQIQLF